MYGRDGDCHYMKRIGCKGTLGNCSTRVCCAWSAAGRCAGGLVCKQSARPNSHRSRLLTFNSVSVLVISLGMQVSLLLLMYSSSGRV